MTNSKEAGADTLTKDELLARSKTDKRLAREMLSYGSLTYGAEMLASWAPHWKRADLRRSREQWFAEHVETCAGCEKCVPREWLLSSSDTELPR